MNNNNSFSKKMFLPLTVASLFTVGLVLATSSQVTAKKEKATICHLPAGDIEKAHTLHVGASAVPAHLGHGDYLGECMDGNEDPGEGGGEGNGGGGSIPF